MDKRRKVTLMLGTLIAHGAIAAPMTIEVHGKLKPGSDVRVSAFDRAEHWLSKAVGANKRGVSAMASEQRMQAVEIADLAPGNYAIAVYVDENGNGKLDRGMFGIPSEPYGFSRGGGTFGPPDFADALVEHSEAGSTIRIDLK